MSRVRRGNSGLDAAVRVGIIGCGDVSAAYLGTLRGDRGVDVVALADRHPERARARAEEFGVAWHGSPEQLLSREDIELVLNLTTPASHRTVSADILLAGKHLWSEKPLATTASDARELLALAAAGGVTIGCAPDTALAAGVRSAVGALEAGVIGRVESLVTVAASGGPDRWHPRPEFLFAAGGGPVLDIGPYYLTVMLMMFGDVDEVAASGRRRHHSRTIAVGDRAGESFDVQVWTDVTAEIRFTSGLRARSRFSFDSDTDEQRFEVNGSNGVLSVPIDGFTGQAMVRGTRPQSAWAPLRGVAIEPGPAASGRGSGVVEQAAALRAGREPLLNGGLAARVLEVLEAIVRSADAGAAPVSTTSPAAHEDRGSRGQRVSFPWL